MIVGTKPSRKEGRSNSANTKKPLSPKMLAKWWRHSCKYNLTHFT